MANPTSLSLLFPQSRSFWGQPMKIGLGASTLVLAAFAMGGVALGADAPVPKAPVYTKAPPAPACGPYWAAFGGWNSVKSMSALPDPDLNGDGVRTIDFKDGYVAGGAVGRCLPGWNWLRVEGELSYRKNNVGSVTVQDEGTTSRPGSVTALALMANAWADYNLAPNVTVHAGGGIGAARVKLKADICGPFCGPADSAWINDSHTVFAFQVGAGAALHFSPSWALTIDYRYFQAGNGNFRGTLINGGTTPFTYRDDYTAQSVMVGLRGKFVTGGP
jgi:opacity protein-like surface antigen